MDVINLDMLMPMESVNRCTAGDQWQRIRFHPEKETTRLYESREKVINRDLDDMIMPDGGGYTVLQLTKKYIAQKTGVKHTTRAGYETVINLLTKDPVGAKRCE